MAAALLVALCSLLLAGAPVCSAGAAPRLDQEPSLDELDLVKYILASREKWELAQKQQSQAPVSPGAETVPAPEQIAAAAAPMSTYTVRRGDTLWGIARTYGTTIAHLKSWNGLQGDMIRVGQSLQVGYSQQQQVHVVQSGESLWSIANRYRTSVAALASANGLASRAVLQPGQRLSIPVASVENARSGNASFRFLWPVVGTITSGWGYRTRFEKFHYGLDIAAKTGTPIKAVRAGVVEYAGWKNGYGYCVFLDHGDGLKTAYGHASKLYVKRGQRVEQGQSIAAVGSTGFSTGPHVHFEVRISGRLVNPRPYLPN